MLNTFGTIFQNKFHLMYHMLAIKTYRKTIYKITIYSIELSKFSNHYIQHSCYKTGNCTC